MNGPQNGAILMFVTKAPHTIAINAKRTELFAIGRREGLDRLPFEREHLDPTTATLVDAEAAARSEARAARSGFTGRRTLLDI